MTNLCESSPSPSHASDFEGVSFLLPWISEQATEGVRLGVTGDFVVNQNLEERILTEDHRPFEAIRPWAESLDLLIMTLDATFPGDDPKSSEPRVVTGPATLRQLPRAGITLMNLGNNHAFDMGVSGFQQLRDELRNQGVSWVGAGENREEAEKPWVRNIDGIEIAIHSAVHSGSHPRQPLSCGGQVASLESESWWESIRHSITEGYTTIALLHGGIQDCQYPSVFAIEISRKLVALGVSAVIWSHAHVVQGGERLGKSLIAYGLGNTFYPRILGNPEDQNSNPRYDWGLLLDLTVAQNSINAGKGLMVHRRGLQLSIGDDSTLLRQQELRRLSRLLNSRFYPLIFRGIRIWEDVILHTWRYFRRDNVWRQIRRIDYARIRGLIKSLRNARSDPEDV